MLLETAKHFPWPPKLCYEEFITGILFSFAVNYFPPPWSVARHFRNRKVLMTTDSWKSCVSKSLPRTISYSRKTNQKQLQESRPGRVASFISFITNFWKLFRKLLHLSLVHAILFQNFPINRRVTTQCGIRLN